MKTIANTFADGVAQALQIKTEHTQWDGAEYWEASVTCWGREFTVRHPVRRAAVLQLAMELYAREIYYDPASAR